MRVQPLIKKVVKNRENWIDSDSFSEFPAYVSFKRPVYKVNEKNGKVVIQIRRTGDLSRKIVAR